MEAQKITSVFFCENFERHISQIYHFPSEKLHFSYSRMNRCLPSLSPSRSPTHLPAGKHRGRQDQETQKKCLVEMLIDKQTHTLSYYDCSSQRIMKHISKAYLCYVCLLIDGHKDFVQKCFKVITLDPVHDKPFQWGH